MTLRDDPDSAKKIGALVAARAHADYQRANELLRELNTDPDDSFLLMLMLARQAAALAHGLHHVLDADVMPRAQNPTGAETVALQMIAMVANDELGSACDLAVATLRIGGTHPRHTQAVIVELVDIVATGGPAVGVGVTHADPRLN